MDNYGNVNCIHILGSIQILNGLLRRAVSRFGHDHALLLHEDFDLAVE